MRFSDSEILEIRNKSEVFGIAPEALSAIIAVESEGTVHLPGSRLPLIRWEGHYFYRLLNGEERTRAVAAGLASPHAGAIRNPSSITERYHILATAKVINEEAAYSSISIGVGQVMGVYSNQLGFSSARDMFDTACTGFDGQLRILMGFIVMKDLVGDLKRRDWTSVARGYNGPNYRKNNYDKKLSDAYQNFVADPRYRAVYGLSDSSDSNPTVLRSGSKGARVRELQRLVNCTGGTLKIDGDFGPATRNAVKEFQRKHDLHVDGIAGPDTIRQLFEHAPASDEIVGASSSITLNDAKVSGAASAGGIGTMAAADKLEEMAGNLRLGSKGARVRELQRLVNRTGGMLKIDGDFGPATRDAVKEFQRKHDLHVDGIAGPDTIRQLFEHAPASDEIVGASSSITLNDAKVSGAASVSGIGTMAAADKLEEMAGRITGPNAEGVPILADFLYLTGAVLIIIGVIWTWHAWKKAQETYEGVPHSKPRHYE